ncbi:hypothetical protein CEXT_378681 [Caerostris extrusa]|uniref:Uncharacterized protein n=1 Tax=Caerostris extrusa TaxID=172846 RepID=A0AAV4XDJ4_CAEEX|nr:hypothetical protein CEXT_378681 [Caerostris extrusa]
MTNFNTNNRAQSFQAHKIADNISFADIVTNKNNSQKVNNNNLAPPQVNNLDSAPPKGNNHNSAPILSDAALHLFKNSFAIRPRRLIALSFFTKNY